MRNPDLPSSNAIDCRKSQLAATHIKRWFALPLMVTGFAAAGLPAAATTYYNPRPYRASVDDYEECTGSLLGTGLGTEAATAACAGALYPAALSECVTTIDSETELTATDALSGCRRVRRPHELASCVVGITGISSEGTRPLDVIDYCRRSLLPVRFSNCVVGLASQTPATSTTETMTTCIAATNRPRQVLPNFIPSGQPVPLQPLPNVDSGTTSTPAITPSTPTPEPTTTTPPAQPPRSVPALW